MGFAEALDRAIGAVSPGWQRARMADRFRSTMIEHGIGTLTGGGAQRSYAGATMVDRHSNWIAPQTSANVEIAGSIKFLRARSRQLVRDEGWPATAVRRIVSNAIGDGLRCTVEHPVESKRKKAQALWNRWAESTTCDADGALDFYGLQALLLRAAIEGGDCLARRRWRRPEDALPLPFQIQLLEGDHLDDGRDTFGLGKGGRLVKQGIEFDALGRRAGYWLFREHPGELRSNRFESVFVPADSVAHAYRIERAGQISGVPWGAPTFLAQRMLGNWKDATLYRLQAAACLVAIVTGGDPSDDPNPLGATPGNASKNRPEVLNPGAMLYPDDAQSVTFSNPPGVQGTDTFSHSVLLEVAAAYGVPYEVMTGDLSKVNYSSGRMGFLEFARELRTWRRDVVVRPFCDPAFRWFLEAAALAGELEDDGRFRASWTPSRREFVDAQKEIAGIVAEVRAGLSTWSEKARENGWSPEDLVDEYKQDLEMLDKAGLSFDTDPRRAAAGAGAPQPADTPSDGGTDNGDGKDPTDGEKAASDKASKTDKASDNSEDK